MSNSKEIKTPNIDRYIKLCQARGRGKQYVQRNGKIYDLKTNKEVQL